MSVFLSLLSIVLALGAFYINKRIGDKRDVVAYDAAYVASRISVSKLWH